MMKDLILMTPQQSYYLYLFGIALLGACASLWVSWIDKRDEAARHSAGEDDN